MSPYILRAKEELPPVPEGNVVHFLRSNPRSAGANDPVYTSLDGRRVLGYGKAISIADQLAYGLRHVLHLAPGDRIAIVASNSIGYPVLIHACLVAGVVPVPLAPALLPEELSHPFADAEVKLVITDPEQPTINKVRDALVLAHHPRAKNPETVWLMPDAPDMASGSSGEKDLRVLLESSKALPIHFVDKAELTVAIIMYSSGTTGRMKGALLSHRNLSAAILMTTTGAALPEGQKTLCVLPLYHGYAMMFFAFRTFMSGTQSVIARNFDLVQMCRAIEQHKVTYLAVVPPIMVLLAKSPVPEQYDLSSLQLVSCGAAPLSGQVADQVRDRLRVKIGQGYAMTETSIALAKAGLAEQNLKVDSASSGQLVPGLEARLVNSSGQDVGGIRGPDGATLEGEIWVRGPNVFMGYLNSPEATRDSFVDGWFRTGDLAYFKEGLVFLTGRSKDLIKVGGRQYVLP